ncbi:hypothetical protein CEV08_07085 [Bartonella tribocorum]|uniref:Uncharacterized protein n=1 Tax=Bartonella tribocorum TaxID=85701 RepID=A0A2M6US39_9HYPH|nr:hypothetical protein CEV08_07085 [Bartonella tribocorum]
MGSIPSSPTIYTINNLLIAVACHWVFYNLTEDFVSIYFLKGASKVVFWAFTDFLRIFKVFSHFYHENALFSGFR